MRAAPDGAASHGVAPFASGLHQDHDTTFAIKTEIRDPDAKRFDFPAQKTMHGGKRIAQGDVLFVFASENEGGCGLIARDAPAG